MSIERDRCAIAALQIALRHLGSPDEIDGRLTAKGQDIAYIQMTLDTYDGVLDESGSPMHVATKSDLDVCAFTLVSDAEQSK